MACTFGFIERGLGDLVARRGHITLLAAPLFLWFSTRMFGGLRAALNEVFDTEENRPWPIAKLIDLAMVFVVGTLFLANAINVRKVGTGTLIVGSQPVSSGTRL